MLSERDIEQAHPEAFDFVFGNLPSAKRAEFNRHLAGCRYCQAVVERVQRDRRDHQAASAARRAASRPRRQDRRRHGRRARRAEGHPSAARTPRTRPPPGPTRFPGASLREPETQVQPRPQPGPPPGPQARPVVTRLPVWRRYRGRLAAVAAVAAAAITGAIAIPLSLLGSGAATVHPAFCHHGGQGERRRSSYRAGNGPAGCLGQLEHHLDRASPQELRGCQVVRMLVHRLQTGTAAGGTRLATFLVSDSRSQTFTMTSAVDPHDFKTMVITLEPPNNTGALSGNVILSGQTL